ncbi:hypothetical protein EMPS_05835 [Entomortierella parvispora]|uniref:Uncharacterized protein n=1 Tax=Entomortierella parvispora TaxID=205924 RepID=A0A9P3LWV5_9FUNG|nr:hypothetical protein EMPS_05835 [Entomortierella parvispora]
MIHVPFVNLPAVLAGSSFIQFVAAAIYGPLFGQAWLNAMKTDRGDDHWTTKDPKNNDYVQLFFTDFAINIGRAWITGLLLNLTQAQTVSHAAQLGLFLFLGTYLPVVTSELMWEKRSFALQKYKIMIGFSSTVVLSCLMHAIGTA